MYTSVRANAIGDDGSLICKLIMFVTWWWAEGEDIGTIIKMNKHNLNNKNNLYQITNLNEILIILVNMVAFTPA